LKARCVLLVLAILVLPVAARGKEERISLLDAAKIAMTLGDGRGAQKILSIALKIDPSSIEALFLSGEIDEQDGRYQDGVARFRQILVDHPKLVRVRLDLARSLFEMHDDVAAAYHFRLVLAQPGLPQSVIDNVYRYLTAIRQRKRFIFFLDFGLAPDTNINAAPALNQVMLFGLPFTLSEPAKQKSGVGVVFSANGEYRAPLSPDVRLRTGASIYRADYPGGMFDDMQFRADVGPQFLFSRSDVSVLAVLAKRSFGNDPYNEGYGGRIEASHMTTDRLRIEGYVEGLSWDYHTQAFLDGFTVNGVLFATYGLTSSSFVRLITGVGTERTASPAFANNSVRLGAGYEQNFPYGLTVYVEPDVTVSGYDAVDPAFAKRRIDRLYSVRLALNKRDWQVEGFSPVFAYTFTHDDSNIDFYRFDRHQFEIGMTREF
jgi:hypothetical protein